MPRIRLTDVASLLEAPLGRHESLSAPKNASVKFKVGKVQINAQGKDRDGYTWGKPCHLYCATTEHDGNLTVFYIRAIDRPSAITEVRRIYPNAKFHRGAPSATPVLPAPKHRPSAVRMRTSRAPANVISLRGGKRAS